MIQILCGRLEMISMKKHLNLMVSDVACYQRFLKNVFYSENSRLDPDDIFNDDVMEECNGK